MLRRANAYQARAIAFQIGKRKSARDFRFKDEELHNEDNKETLVFAAGHCFDS
jgi:hypothetical protein